MAEDERVRRIWLLIVQPTKDSVVSTLISEVTSLFEEFLNVEERLFDRSVSGVHYWHLIRFPFFDSILQGKKWIKKKRPTEQKNVWETLGIVIRVLKNSLLYSTGRDLKQTDLVILNHRKKLRGQGLHVDPYFQPWLEEIEASFSSWEEQVMWQHARHGGEPDLFYLDSFYLRAAVYRFAHSLKKETVRREVVELVSFARQFEVELSAEGVRLLIEQAVSVQKSCYRIIQKRLRRKRPLAIVLVNHYSTFKMVITAAAKSLGIRVIELQHGSMGRYHIAYNFGHNLKLSTLPDEILTFGKFWNDTTRITRNGVRLTAVGYPHFEEKIRRYQGMAHKGKTKLLFLSQETIGHLLGQVALEVWRQLDSEKYEVIYKLHPREFATWRSTYPNDFVASGIEVLGDVDLYELLALTDIHVGVYSTTVIESLGFSKKLILFEAYGVHYFCDLIKIGRAVLASSAADIVAKVGELESKSNNVFEYSYYWKEGSKASIVKRMREVLCK